MQRWPDKYKGNKAPGVFLLVHRQRGFDGFA